MDSFEKRLQSLVGIPFGKKAPPEEADCVTLCIYAQELLFGKKIDLSEIETKWDYCILDLMSHTIKDIVLRFCEEVAESDLKLGDIIITDTLGFTHILTVATEDKMLLHIGIKASSRLAKYRTFKKAKYYRFL